MGRGFTSTSALKWKVSPSTGWSDQSMVGRSTGSMPDTATARRYQADRWCSSASSITASRPIRCMTRPLGALPLRNPGRRTDRERSSSAWSKA